jgi:ArsR family metal-binding transcriptional regulator
MKGLFGDAAGSPPAAAKPSSPAEKRPLIRSDGQYACTICGEAAHFGFGVKLLAGRAGRWACGAHRDALKTNSNK